MARLPEGALMQRAAAGLAAACADLLGRVYGRRVVLLVGSGDNGGDALYAGARLARRGAGVTAVLLAPERAHAGGLARAAARAGGRVGRRRGGAEAVRSRGPTSSSTASSGSAAGAGCGPTRPRLCAARVRRRGPPSSPSTCRAGSTPTPARCAGAAVRADAHRHLRHAQAGAAHRPGARVRRVRCGSSTSGSAPTCRRPDAGGAPARRRGGGCCRVPAAESDKYRRGVVGIAAGSARYPGAAVLAVAGALRGGAGAVRYVGPAGGRRARPLPRDAGVRPGRRAGRARAGLGRRAPGPGTTRPAVAEVLAADVPVLVDADGLRLADAGRPCGPRTAPTLMTPHAGEAAALLGASPREAVEGARLRRGARTGRALRGDGAAQGLDHAGRRRRRRRRTGQRRPGRPGWPPPGAGTCCPASPGRCWRRASRADAGSVARVPARAGGAASRRTGAPRAAPTTWPRRFRRPGATCGAADGRSPRPTSLLRLRPGCRRRLAPRGPRVRRLSGRARCAFVCRVRSQADPGGSRCCGAT